MTSVDELKSLANVPDMKGLELAKYPLRNPLLCDENATIFQL
jgi:hypothetical protein